MKNNCITSTFIGLAVGDALGVPVEFRSRESLRQNPVVDMRSFGTHEQPKGTWSDDSSLTFCLTESLCNGYDLKDISIKFAQWYSELIWTQHGKVFDIGNTTRRAIEEFLRNNKTRPMLGGSSEYDNGNGSLMRISPLVYYIKDVSIEKRFDIIKDISKLTHGHIRSTISCFIYLEFFIEVINGLKLKDAYDKMKRTVNNFLLANPICSQKEIDTFNRVLTSDIETYKEDEIKSGGYVVHTLEASLWCLLNTNSYSEAVLKAVNLGDDTDTTATVVGAIAGMHYGLSEIPKEWIESLVRKEDIFNLSNQFAKKYGYES